MSDIDGTAPVPPPEAQGTDRPPPPTAGLPGRDVRRGEVHRDGRQQRASGALGGVRGGHDVALPRDGAEGGVADGHVGPRAGHGRSRRTPPYVPAQRRKMWLGWNTAVAAFPTPTTWLVLGSNQL